MIVRYVYIDIGFAGRSKGMIAPDLKWKKIHIVTSALKKYIVTAISASN